MQIIEDRRALHRIPELELDLPETMVYLQKSLSKLNCSVFSPIPNSVCAFFDFGADHAIAFRADCDALPIVEKTELPFASCHPGKMHACGHDGHMAILLELARRLSGKKSLRHNILLIFQPGEETPGGALPICKAGVLEKYHVRHIFGLHLWPALTPGHVFSRKQELMSRSSEVNIDIYGKSAHIGKAHEGIDATAAAVELYRRVTDAERALPETVYRLLKFGLLQSGTVRNALSAHCHMEGSLRAFQEDVFLGLKNKIITTAKEVEDLFGCRIQLHFSEGYPAVLNPEDLFQTVQRIAPFDLLEEPSMTSEDFGWYQKYVPGMFFFLGLGDVPTLHSDRFNFDETILLKGADFFEKLAENLP